MNLLYPTIPWRLWPRMLGMAVIGALIAGAYGVVHDQITYSISPEYFTQMKFDQFSYANFGFPTRVFVGEIGFLASWWVGFFSAWFLARIAVPVWPYPIAFRKSFTGFSVILVTALISAVIGYLYGLNVTGDDEWWRMYCHSLKVTDVVAFIRVAYIHNASYLGGLIGLIVALIGMILSKGRFRRNRRDLSQHDKVSA